VTGCDLPSATLDVNAVPYVIYAVYDISSRQANGVLALLNSFLPDDPNAIFTATDISGKLL
jgi:hypothetical protein